MPVKIFKNGQVFGRLTIINAYVENRGTQRAPMWCHAALCSCGKTTIVRTSHLSNGHTRSCGCLAAELKTTHGMCNSEEYRIWVGMRQRCTNERAVVFEGYGGRGIKVCERWLASFENFYADMGKRPTKKHSIDRIDNNNGYSPDNCRWGTSQQQSRNQRVRSCSVTRVSGVSIRNDSKKKYRAYISISGKRICLGSFETIEEAAKARKCAEVKYW